MRASIVAIFVAGSTNLASSAGLVDNPVEGDSLVYLDSSSGLSWRGVAPSRGLSMPVTVPGDVITDLQTAGLIGDPLYELNFLNSSIWDATVWNYSVAFTATPAQLAAAQTLVVFDGIKMGATISLNGAVLGQAQDQFLRYSFDVTKLLAPGAGANSLTVQFDPSIGTDGRFMACTGGWDWAPYSPTTTPAQPGTARVFSRGIWKSVYLVTAASAFITHVVPHTFYTGPFPTQALSDDAFAPFTLSVRTHLSAPAPTSGTLTVSVPWGVPVPPVPLSLPAGESNVTVNVTAGPGQVSLWWPVGMGAQALYAVNVSWTPAAAPAAPVLASRRVGFRYFALVTGNDTDPAYVQANAGVDGTDTLGMRFRVNGAPIWARGANMIPPDEMEGRYSAAVLERQVQSAVDANFNMLRVWGGGVFLPDAFYDACDALGILLYHDMQFAQEGHSPDVTPTEDAEFRHQIRRLSHHPSLALIDGCNECHVIIGTPTGIYATFVLTVVMEEDKSRVLWPSCPSNGWKAGVHRLDSIPDGSSLGLLPNARPPTAIDGPRGSVAALSANGATTLGLPGAQTCNYTQDMDVNADGSHTDGTTPEDCCPLCFADSQCTSVVWYQGTCWLKHGGTPVSKPGRVMCTPVNKPPAPHTIETHGPYQHGSGFPAVNGAADLQPFDPQIPIKVSNSTLIGMQYPNVFASEFGCSVFSSFESMTPTLAPEHWGIQGGAPPDNCTGGFESTCKGNNMMAQRNYPCNNILSVYFNVSSFNLTGAKIFQQHLWQCMIGQALNIKSNIEVRRGTNQFGHLVWQYGEIWPTGGWGSIEYATAAFTGGQVLGGRWKPLHYWYRASIFAEVMASCGVGGECYVRNDRPGLPFTGTLSVASVSFATGETTYLLQNSPLSLPPGPGAASFFSVGAGIDGTQSILVATVTAPGGAVVSKNVIPLVVPGAMVLRPASVGFSVSQVANPDGSVNISVTTDAVAVYVTFTTLAQGRFSDNAFLLLPGASTLTFIPWGGPADIPLLTSSTRVEHVALYQ